MYDHGYIIVIKCFTRWCIYTNYTNRVGLVSYIPSCWKCAKYYENRLAVDRVIAI